MRRKLTPIGNSQGVSIPKDILEKLHLKPGDTVELTLDEKKGQILIQPIISKPEELLDKEFVTQVNDFITQYKPALDELARK